VTQLLDALDQPHVQLLLRLVLGGLLLLAGVTKLVDRASFRQAVAEYGVLPERLEWPFAALLPWMETAVGVLLLVGLGGAVAAWLAVPIFLSFGVAIGVNLWRGRHFDCHCFGSVHSEEIGWLPLLRSAALVLTALVVALGASRFGALDLVLFGSNAELPPAGEVVPVVFLAAVVFDVLILVPEAIAFQVGFSRLYAKHVARPAGHRPKTPVLNAERSA
jgi:uncharacterized membrane protein YphA (DoxX/SURF4 family)